MTISLALSIEQSPPPALTKKLSAKQLAIAEQTSDQILKEAKESLGKGASADVVLVEYVMRVFDWVEDRKKPARR